MSCSRILGALSSIVFVTACTTVTSPPGAERASAKVDEHATHHPARAGAEPMRDRMQAMHDKMMNAKTPEERRTLMDDHMKAMQDGMPMMNRMGRMGPGADRGDAGQSRAAHPDMAMRQKMMEDRLDMMQLMLNMMLQRMPESSAVN
jgi:hypothetical protein